MRPEGQLAWECPPLTRLWSSPYPQAYAFLMENSWRIFRNDYSSPLQTKATRGSFLDFSRETMVRFLEFKAHGDPIKLWTAQVSDSHAGPHSASSISSKSPFKSPHQIMASAASPQVSKSQLSLWICPLAQIWGGRLPRCLMGSRKVISFKCV